MIKEGSKVRFIGRYGVLSGYGIWYGMEGVVLSTSIHVPDAAVQFNSEEVVSSPGCNSSGFPERSVFVLLGNLIQINRFTEGN